MIFTYETGVYLCKFQNLKNGMIKSRKEQEILYKTYVSVISGAVSSKSSSSSEGGFGSLS